MHALVLGLLVVA